MICVEAVQRVGEAGTKCGLYFSLEISSRAYICVNNLEANGVVQGDPDGDCNSICCSKSYADCIVCQNGPLHETVK